MCRLQFSEAAQHLLPLCLGGSLATAMGHLWLGRPRYVAADEPSPCGCPQQIQLTIKGWLCGLLCQQGKVLGAQRIPKRAVQMGLLSDRKSTPPHLTPQVGTSLPFLSSAGLQQSLLVCSNERTSHGTYKSILNLRSPVHVNRTLKGHF